MVAERSARSGALEAQITGEREDQNDQQQEAQRRPAVVAPSTGVAVTTTEQCEKQKDYEQGNQHLRRFLLSRGKRTQKLCHAGAPVATIVKDLRRRRRRPPQRLIRRGSERLSRSSQSAD